MTTAALEAKSVHSARDGRETTRRVAWLDALTLGVVYAVSIASLAGFAVFAMHPSLLGRVPGAAEVYGRMFVIAPRAQIIVVIAALSLFLSRRVGARWLPSFVAVYALSLASELAGTTIGLPFGPYSYTDGLGFKLFDHVPALIPASWFFMALPSYAFARRRFPHATHRWRRVVLGSLVLLSWDLVLDPAMSLVTKYWVWESAGSHYYGMPLLNLVGWYVTGLALMAAFVALRTDDWLPDIPVRWFVAFYCANLLLPIGMSLAAGLWGAVTAASTALGACWLFARGRVADA
jgi:putative membrane protein